MKDPKSLLDNINNENLQGDLPPVENWHPEHCGDSEICIHRDGSWSHQGTSFKRQKLVDMFSRIIRLDDDGEYYLVTPVEKMKLKVEDVPFLAIGFEVLMDEGVQKIVFETSVGDRVMVDEPHAISVQMVDGEPAPYVLVRRNLKARIARSVYYQLIDMAREEQQGDETLLYVESCGTRYELGRY